ncbi:MAG: hypothetical protein NVS1B10_04720 [Candidatus Saccharimonadales bacterium]
MNPDKVLKTSLERCHMMQLATVSNNLPWSATVYYVHDDDYNIYWASLESRQHSHHLEINPNVAVTIPVNFKKVDPVVGIQMAGLAKKLELSEANRNIVSKYALKFSRSHEWIDDFIKGKTDHKLYKFIPHKIVLFDEVNFKDSPKKVILNISTVVKGFK